jgi:hypothetical protein
MEIADDFGVDLPPLAFDRLMTAIQILTTDHFFQRVPDYVRACVVLDGLSPPGAALCLPSIDAFAWGTTEGLLISGLMAAPETLFAPTIRALVHHCLVQDGFLQAPIPLAWAMPPQPPPEGPAELVALAEERSERLCAEVQDYTVYQMQRLLMQLQHLELESGDTRFLQNWENYF